MITLEKLDVYSKHSGDAERLMWAEQDAEINLFEGNGDWALIKSLYHDIDLIRSELAAQSYIEQALQTIKDNCDEAAGELLRDKILKPEAAPAKLEPESKRKWWKFW